MSCLTKTGTLKFGAAALLVAAISAVTSAGAVSIEPQVVPDKIFKAQLVEDIGASERVNFSGKLRMLSQRVAASTCNLAAGIAPEESRKVLSAASSEFEMIVDALQNGNPQMNVIGAESRRKTLFVIDQMWAEWRPIKASIDNVLTNGPDDENVALIAGRNMPLLSVSKLLVSEISGQYSNPADMLQSDAMLVDISGRQRMLTQKMSKEACHVLSGDDSQATRDALARTMQTFDVSLDALRNGLTDAGIKKAPTPEIGAGLKVVWDQWQPIKANLGIVADGGSLDDDTRSTLFLSLNKALKDMNSVVGLYSDFAKHKY